MTDEEKAEEILQTKGSMTFCAKGCGYTEKVKELITIGLAEGRKEGYEQGYEDCRHYAHDYYKPKWHDLRKEPNDLPKESEEVLAVYSNTYGAKGLLTDKNHLRYKLVQYYLEEEIGEWLWVESGTDDDIHEVIAWCELPKFEE